jgi:hypothetical protein
MSNINDYGVWQELPNELYVIGDIHGDFFALKQSLELTGCVTFDKYNDKLKLNDKDQYYYLDDGCEYYSIIKNNVKWNFNKKNCFIVFLGDLIDRCRPNSINNKKCINTVNDENCDYLLLKLLYELDDQAKNYGSRVIVILGNHEIMNIQGEFIYVSLKGKKDKERINNIQNYLKTNLSNVYGIIRINKYIMAHGGINDNFFNNFNINNDNQLFESIELFNYKLRSFLLTNDSTFLNDDNLYQSPFWDRKLGGRDILNENQCNEIFENNLLKIKNFDSIKNEIKIIVAHCPQFVVNQIINLVDCQEYEKKIWRIDVGMSRGFDLYDMYKIENILSSTNYNEILNMNYKDFFIINSQTENRKVSCIKLTQTEEIILEGKTTIDYFYGLEMFNKKIIMLYILSDLIKIYIDNFNKNYYPTEQYKYLLYINKLKYLIFIEIIFYQL